jgi:uncharacterized protein (DUF1778 family)
MPQPVRAAKRTTLNIRIKAQERGLIDRAARESGQNRTDFILDAARKAATDTLLDRTMIVVDSKAYGKFLKRLEAPPKANARLKRTMRTRQPWDQA